MKARAAVLRIGPWCGIVVPGFDFLVNGCVALAQEKYDPLRCYISDLSAPEMAYSGLLRSWWIAIPFLFTPFVLAVGNRVRDGRLPWLPPLLLFVFALAIGLCGVFHCDAGCAGKTFSGRAHGVVSNIAAATIVLAPIALAATTWNDRRWDRFRAVNYAWMPLEWAAGISLYLAKNHDIPYPGLCERLFYGVVYGWLILLALHLLRHHSSAAAAHSAYA